MGIQIEKYLQGTLKPQELLTPHTELGGGGMPPADRLPTSEGFERIPFYDDLNMYHLSKAPIAQRILASGIGTGSDIVWLWRSGKIKSPFNIIGIDKNEADLTKAASRLAMLVNQARGDSLTFIKKSANELGKVVADKSFDLITALNSIHLYDDPASFFVQAWRKLHSGGSLLVSTAYARNVMFPDPHADRRAWGNIVISALIDLKQQGFTNIPKPDDPGKYATDDYIAMALKAGFRISTEVRNVFIPRDEAKQLVSVDEFVAGTLPEVPLDVARTALQRGVDATLNRSGASGLNRGWFLVYAVAS